MTLEDFLNAYCHDYQTISVGMVKDNGIKFTDVYQVYTDEFLKNDHNSKLFDMEVVDIRCLRGEVLHINVKGE